MELLAEIFQRLLKNCDEEYFVEIQNNKRLVVDGSVDLTHEEVAILAKLGVHVCNFDH